MDRDIAPASFSLILIILLITPGYHAVNITVYLEDLRETYCLQEDHFIPGNILICSRNALVTVRPETKQIREVAGLETQEGYLEGVGTDARFKTVSDIVQLNSTAAIIIDHENNCLRELNRLTDRTKKFAGNCLQSGSRDGSLDTASFYLPYRMVHADDSLYLVEYKEMGLRQISLIALTVNRLTSDATVYRPSSIIFEQEKQALYLTIDHGVAQHDLATGHTSLIAGTTLLEGDEDGPALRAALSEPRAILLKGEKMLIADRANAKLKVLNMRDQTLETVAFEIVDIMTVAEVHGDVLIGVRVPTANVYKLDNAKLIFVDDPSTSVQPYTEPQTQSTTSKTNVPATTETTKLQASHDTTTTTLLTSFPHSSGSISTQRNRHTALSQKTTSTTTHLTFLPHSSESIGTRWKTQPTALPQTVEFTTLPFKMTDSRTKRTASNGKSTTEPKETYTSQTDTTSQPKHVTTGAPMHLTTPIQKLLTEPALVANDPDDTTLNVTPKAQASPEWSLSVALFAGVAIVIIVACTIVIVYYIHVRKVKSPQVQPGNVYEELNTVHNRMTGVRCDEPPPYYDSASGAPPYYDSASGASSIINTDTKENGHTYVNISKKWAHYYTAPRSSQSHQARPSQYPAF